MRRPPHRGGELVMSDGTQGGWSATAPCVPPLIASAGRPALPADGDALSRAACAPNLSASVPRWRIRLR